MTVRFSYRCRNAAYPGFEATPEAIIASAAKAEELGFDAVFVNAGRFVTFADMNVSPKPLQQPYPPIWLGGLSDAALRRAAVWQPTPTPLADLLERRSARLQGITVGCRATDRARYAQRGRG